MSKELVESILNGDYVSANELFEQRLADIQEKKMYEMKRMIAAEMNEVFGMGMTKAEIEAKKKAGYKKASDVLSDPRDIKLPLFGQQKSTPKKKKKRVSEETLDESGLGDAVRAAHALRKAGPDAIRQFRGAMSLRRLGRGSQRQNQQSSDYERPGVIRRNVNTLMGREPGYVAPEKKPEQKGGRVGKALRTAGGLWSRTLQAGMSGSLEE